MTQIPGVTIKKNENGKITHVTIDVEQQKELAQPVLEQLGIFKEDEFETVFKNGHTLEESEVVVIEATKEKYAEKRLLNIENTLTLKESLQSTIHFVDQFFDAKGKN